MFQPVNFFFCLALSSPQILQLFFLLTNFCRLSHTFFNPKQTACPRGKKKKEKKKEKERNEDNNQIKTKPKRATSISVARKRERKIKKTKRKTNGLLE